jgi:predicted house-cleaning noncanonical NTP pyrophosphatase (MazG superfamily)
MITNVEKWNKLVRDGIPAKIEMNGEVAVSRILNEEDFDAELIKKLGEEVAEFQKDQNTEELADLLEIIYAIAERHGVPSTGLENIREAKLAKWGGFTKKIYLEETYTEK